MEHIADKVRQEIISLLEEREQVLVAIDGRCAAGKTTLAMLLQTMIDCHVFHMDDFFLRPEQRTAERLNIPGENVDHERFEQEVLIPLKAKQVFRYRPFSCKEQQLKESIQVIPSRINVIEGSYSCHPQLEAYYDMKIYLGVDHDLQLKRIISRNGIAAAEIFKQKWIPLEEKYFKQCKIEESCDLVFYT